jgi:hypothetical protein
VVTACHPREARAAADRAAFAFDSNSPKTADPLPDILAATAPER